MEDNQPIVLIVDDEASVRTVMTFILRKAEIYTLEAATQEAACKLLQENPGIQLAIIDINLNGTNGIQVVKKLRKIKPNLKVIYVTGYGILAPREKDTTEESDQFLQKPFSAEGFQEKILSILRSQ